MFKRSTWFEKYTDETPRRAQANRERKSARAQKKAATAASARQRINAVYVKLAMHWRWSALRPEFRAVRAHANISLQEENKKSTHIQTLPHEKNLNVRPIFMMYHMATVRGRRITQQPFIHELVSPQRHHCNQPCSQAKLQITALKIR